MVVPMLAPKIVPTACVNVIRPALTKPTSITVVVLLLCTSIVVTIPVKTAISGLVVRNSKILRKRAPAACCIPEAIKVIP